MYACIVVSGTLAPEYISKIGAKWSLVTAWVSHCLYTIANFYPRWATMVPASVLLGVLAGPLWTSQGVYLSHQGYKYAEAAQKDPSAVLSKFNGIFFTLFEATHITGNLISSLVLTQPAKEGPYFDNSTSSWNMTLTCGANDCPSSGSVTILAEPNTGLVNTLLCILLGLDIIGLCVTIVFLSPLDRNSDEENQTALQAALSCGRQLVDIRMFLLVPLIVFMAMEQGFLWTQFTKSYISCPLGIGKVGYIMATCGLSTSIFAFVLSRLVIYTGRYVMFSLAGSVDMAVFVVLLFWQPSGGDMTFHFILVIFWGIAGGIWQSQTNVLVALVFPNTPDPAFANYHAWKAFGFTMTFGYSNILCVHTKLYIAMGFLVTGMLCYVILEVKLKVDGSSGSSYEMLEPKTTKERDVHSKVFEMKKTMPLLNNKSSGCSNN